MDLQKRWGQIGRAILGLSLGAMAATFFYFESALVLLRPIPGPFLAVCWFILAVLFAAGTERAASVLARGFAALALFSFLLYPVGKIFQLRLARSSAGEVDLVYHPQDMTETLLDLFITIATSGKLSVVLGVSFSILCALSWTRKA